MILAYLVAGLIVLLAAAIAVVLYGARGQRDIGPSGYALPRRMMAPNSTGG